MNNERLYVNNQEITPCIIRNEIIDDKDSLTLDLPNHTLIDRKNTEKYILDIDTDDAQKLEDLLRGDTSIYIGKKIRILITSIGKAGR